MDDKWLALILVAFIAGVTIMCSVYYTVAGASCG